MSTMDPDPNAFQVAEEASGIPLSVGESAFVAGLAAWSEGAVSVLDQVVPAGLIVPPHLHENEAQASYVVAGTIGFWVDGEEAEVGPGSYVHRPAGKAHSLWNKTAEPARMLEITYPGASFERYIRAVTELIDSGRSDPDSVAALAGEYGVRFVSEPFAELCERHGVSPAGGFWK